jgi:hypothetical protein
LIDTREINTLYGTPENQFNQRFTVETAVINSNYNSSTPYSDPSGTAGSYAISMQNSVNDDLLALGFNTSGKQFVNVAMDISSIDFSGTGCEPPKGIADPIFEIRLIDDPDGNALLDGPVLDTARVEGPAGPNPWTFLWTRQQVALNASNSTNGNVSVVWDLIQSGYGAFDNLVVEASDIAVV